jgi:hypothetical protein
MTHFRAFPWASSGRIRLQLLIFSVFLLVFSVFVPAKADLPGDVASVANSISDRIDADPALTGAAGANAATKMSQSSDLIRKHLIVNGKVQGVFYRDTTVKAAGRIGVTGWVRNLTDKQKVEIQVQGEKSE